MCFFKQNRTKKVLFAKKSANYKDSDHFHSSYRQILKKLQIRNVHIKQEIVSSISKVKLQTAAHFSTSRVIQILNNSNFDRHNYVEKKLFNSFGIPNSFNYL